MAVGLFNEFLSGGRSPQEYRGEGVGGVAFVSSDVCAECHPLQFEQWQASQHRRAMEPAEPSTVLGDFNDAAFTHLGEDFSFSTRNGRYFVTTETADGESVEHEVTYTFGVHPLQQYLIEFPGGRLQCLTVAWDVEGERWFHLYPDEKIAPDDALHWTGRYQVWNHMCASCHTTDLRKNYDSESDSYRTTWAELGVTCQACHGPGEDHVKWARDLRPGTVADPAEYRLAIAFQGLQPESEIQTCAPCHSRRGSVTRDGRQGQSFYDDFMVETLREGLYHADGQILDEVYVYGSFLQSKMYRQGVRCSDCHNPHTLQLQSPGNGVCIRCHQTSPPVEFEGLKAGEYDTPEHHFHKAGTDGAQCVSCHAPERTYMVVDPRRDHSFRVPRPDLSAKLDVPNACNGCHSDESAEWAAGAVDKWYGPDRRREAHFGEILEAGRSGKAGAERDLMRLALDAEQPAIARATALEMLRGYGPDGSTSMIASVQDPNPIVRARAVGGLIGLPPQARLDAAAPALEDPLRSVRVEAARVLASVPREVFGANRLAQFDAALEEYEAAQKFSEDVPSAHMNLARLRIEQGRVELAESHYRTAIRQDPRFVAAPLELAQLYNGQGRNEDAESVLRKALRLSPEEGQIYYSLGLLLAEMQRLPEAAVHLGEAAERLPGQIRIRYNYALALQRLGRRSEAERQFLEAHRAEPADSEVVHALAIFYFQEQRLAEARIYAQKLAERNPGAPGPQQLLLQLDEAIDGAR